jgi:hypothetical protein
MGVVGYHPTARVGSTVQDDRERSSTRVSIGVRRWARHGTDRKERRWLGNAVVQRDDAVQNMESENAMRP